MNNATWIEPEEVAYPSGGFLREGRALVVKNPHNPIELPYGEVRAILASIPDTFFSIPARLRYKGKMVVGFVSYADEHILTFKPEADPENCILCGGGEGCKR